MTAPTRVPTASLLLALALLGGCSASVSTGDRTIDTGEVEQQLIDAQRGASPDLDVGEAVCPPEVDATIGTSFECVVTVDGVEAPYAVRLTGIDENDERGRFDLRPAKAIIGTEKVEEFLAGQLDETAANAVVDCGPARVRVLDAGATFDCTVTDAGGAGTVTLRADDDKGTVVIVGSR